MKNLAVVLAVAVILAFSVVACGAAETPVPLPTNPPQPAEPAAEVESEPEPTATLAAVVESEPAEENAPVEEEAPAATEAEETSPDAHEADAQAEGVSEADEAASPPAEPRLFVIVPEQSRASYIVAEEFFGGALDRLGIQPGLVDTIGSTQEVNGQMELDLSNLADPVVSSRFTVDLSTLTSDQPRRDDRIRERNLESNLYPLATFTITSLENTPAGVTEGEDVTFQALGDITIREITQPATFDVTAKLDGGTITGVAETGLTMSNFGFDPPNFANMFSVEDAFTARVEFTFEEQ